jgi:aryl-alcohol dehydrogenase-like predicted oxidoreductase/enamine deaminase RidA (YjgF/YER057c/UK114 family)
VSTTTVERVALAPGLEMARALTGLWQVADMERDGRVLDLDAAARSMVPYVEGGLTTFDMADHYGSAEDIVGRYRKIAGAPPAQFFTKWVPAPGPVTKAQVRAAVARALMRMGGERIDLLQFHAWRFSDAHWLDALFLLDECRREGLIGALGACNFDTAHVAVAVASGIPFVSNQVCCSLLDRRATGRLADYAEAHGVRTLAYGTLAGGFLSDKWLGRPEPAMDALATWSQMKYKRFIDVAGGWARFQSFLAVLDTVARRLGVSIANVASRWVLEQRGVGGVIIGARLTQGAHVEETQRLFQFTLDRAAHEEIAMALALLHPIPGDCGDEYRKPPYLTASGDLSHHLESFPPPFAVREGPHGRTQVRSGTSWETMYGYARAVRSGPRIHVSGTTASHGDRLIGGTDPYAQAIFALDKVQGAIESLGGHLEDVVRTRVFVSDVAHWEPVARAHGERFGAINPANTLVEARLVGSEYLVEIEADADVPA